MNDRELLELAAKAAELEVQRSRLNDPLHEDFLMNGSSVRNKGQVSFPWNPLTDDGDALRLAVLLGLTICNEHESAAVAYCTIGDESFPNVVAGKAGDPVGITDEDYAATRRAIVRAAAEIGKAMQ